MREPYLLAASLLTGLAIPASALPQMSNLLDINSKSWWNLQQGSQSTVSQKIIPSVDISSPELSGQTLSASQSKIREQIIPSVEVFSPEFSRQDLLARVELSLNPRYQEAGYTSVSGSELYYQRLAALKAGQIYTRIDDTNLRLLWEPTKANKQKLTYEDWKELLALEARAMTRGQGANHLSILVGDSLSMWFPKQKLPTGKLWLNQGISGDTSGGVLRRLTAFSDTRPDVIYVMVGINDLLKGNSDQTILHNHRRIINRLHREHPTAKIIVQSILPIRRTTISNTRIRRLNAQIALIAAQEKASYLNIYDWFTDFSGNLNPDLTTDGVHLSPQGYDVWKSALQHTKYNLTQR